MSTIKATNIAHTSASVSNMVLGSNGAVTFGGSVVGSGLDLITTQSFSAASNVSVNNCFDSTYRNYRIILNVDSVSTTNAVSLRMRASGTDNSSSNYMYNGPDVANSSATTMGAIRSAGATTAFLIIAADSTGTGCSVIDMFNPQAAFQTHIVANSIYTVSTDMRAFTIFQRMTVTTSYDGFSIFPNTGTLTGSVRIYGYKN